MRDWLKEKRTEKGLTMAQISKQLDITEAYYCMIENGERQKKMDVVLANKLSLILGIPVNKIVELEGA